MSPYVLGICIMFQYYAPYVLETCTMFQSYATLLCIKYLYYVSVLCRPMYKVSTIFNTMTPYASTEMTAELYERILYTCQEQNTFDMSWFEMCLSLYVFILKPTQDKQSVFEPEQPFLLELDWGTLTFGSVSE